jgi:hypothetical protein
MTSPDSPDPTRVDPPAVARHSASELCVVCHSKPATHAFLHGRESHLCACGDCAVEVRRGRWVGGGAVKV